MFTTVQERSVASRPFFYVYAQWAMAKAHCAASDSCHCGYFHAPWDAGVSVSTEIKNFIDQIIIIG